MNPKQLIITITTSVTLFAAPLCLQAEDVAIDRASKAFKEAERTLTRSTEVYKQISEGKHGKIPGGILEKTRCVAIFPETVTVSAGLGGTHGDGVGFCKTATGQWENPMFLNLIGGSIGLQAGVKSADMVLYITGERAADAIKRGSFKVGGELSAVAGTFDKTVPSPQAEVVAYSRSQGLFMGASLDGVNISRDDGDERAFYGVREAVTTAQIPDDLQREVNQLREALPPHVG
ncbi:MAG: lipid-binding SYLF domain-containing protein [Bdellovibrionales bacterium]|jgi:lipid-binding SYLF domain-containing protein